MAIFTWPVGGVVVVGVAVRVADAVGVAVAVGTVPVRVGVGTAVTGKIETWPWVTGPSTDSPPCRASLWRGAVVLQLMGVLSTGPLGRK